MKASADDKEYGGKLDEATKLATKALDAFFPRAVVEKLKAFNLDVEPELFKGFYKIGLGLKDDSVAGGLPGGASSRTPQQAMEALYTSMPKS
jgi:hypothetical protein